MADEPWDPVKSDTCLKERGFDFAYAENVFEDADRLEAEDGRENYGEQRIKVIGRINGRFFAVVYTPRGGRKWILSARQAKDEEIKEWRNYMSPPQKPSRAGESTSRVSKRQRKLTSGGKWSKTAKTRKRR